MRSALQILYPPRCSLCGDMVESDFGLCGPCWRDTPLISGLCCDICGANLPGDDTGHAERCDDCLKIARPWSRGRAALIYRGNARRLVLSLKHGDRHDIVPLASKWMAQAAKPILQTDALIAPVPLHWTRLLTRRFNQAALLSQAVAERIGLASCPDLLERRRKTPTLKKMTYDQRFDALDGAITVHKGRKHRLVNRSVILVDDVMTSGATLSAAAQACLHAGAKDVNVLLLARAQKDA
ncbi:MAG: ComF family protein [Pseudomonadota bacterium]